MGYISYSFYLFHYKILYIYNSKKYLNAFALCFTLSLLISFIVNKLYENPIRRIKSKIIICCLYILSFTTLLLLCSILITTNTNYIKGKFGLIQSSNITTNYFINYKEDEYFHKKSNKILYCPDTMKKVWRNFQRSQCFCIFKNRRYISIINKYPILLLLTDSHGEQWFKIIILYAKNMNYVVVHVWFWEDTIFNKHFKNIYKIFTFIPKVLYVISVHWLSDKSNNTIFKENYFIYLKILLKHCEEIYVIHDTPYFKEDPNAYYQHQTMITVFH